MFTINVNKKSRLKQPTLGGEYRIRTGGLDAASVAL